MTYPDMHNQWERDRTARVLRRCHRRLAETRKSEAALVPTDRFYELDRKACVRLRQNVWTELNAMREILRELYW